MQLRDQLRDDMAITPDASLSERSLEEQVCRKRTSDVPLEVLEATTKAASPAPWVVARLSLGALSAAPHHGNPGTPQPWTPERLYALEHSPIPLVPNFDDVAASVAAAAMDDEPAPVEEVVVVVSKPNKTNSRKRAKKVVQQQDEAEEEEVISAPSSPAVVSASTPGGSGAEQVAVLSERFPFSPDAMPAAKTKKSCVGCACGSPQQHCMTASARRLTRITRCSCAAFGQKVKSFTRNLFGGKKKKGAKDPDVSPFPLDRAASVGVSHSLDRWDTYSAP